MLQLRNTCEQQELQMQKQEVDLTSYKVELEKLKKKVESLQSGGQPSDKDNKVFSQCHPSTSKENQKVAGQNAEQ